jgi:hypothetical protein
MWSFAPCRTVREFPVLAAFLPSAVVTSACPPPTLLRSRLPSSTLRRLQPQSHNRPSGQPSDEVFCAAVTAPVGWRRRQGRSSQFCFSRGHPPARALRYRRLALFPGFRALRPICSVATVALLVAAVVSALPLRIKGDARLGPRDLLRRPLGSCLCPTRFAASALPLHRWKFAP